MSWVSRIEVLRKYICLCFVKPVLWARGRKEPWKKFLTLTFTFFSRNAKIIFHHFFSDQVSYFLWKELWEQFWPLLFFYKFAYFTICLFHATEFAYFTRICLFHPNLPISPEIAYFTRPELWPRDNKEACAGSRYSSVFKLDPWTLGVVKQLLG